MYTYVITQRGWSEEQLAPYLVLNVWIVSAYTIQIARNMVEPHLDTFPHPEDDEIDVACIDQYIGFFEEERILWSSKSLR